VRCDKTKSGGENTPAWEQPGLFIGGSAAAPGADGIDGGSGGKESAGKGPPRLFLPTLFFVAGFSAVFIILSVAVFGFMFFLGDITNILNAAAGLVIIVLGFNMIFNFIPFLKADASGGVCETCAPERSVISPVLRSGNPVARRPGRPKGIAGALLTGAAFGVSWTPCTGVILGSILVMASESGKLLLACLYLAFYSLGLGLPFLVCGLLWDKLPRRGAGRFISPAGLRKITLAVRITSGVFLILTGVFIAAGRIQSFALPGI